MNKNIEFCAWPDIKGNITCDMVEKETGKILKTKKTKFNHPKKWWTERGFVKTPWNKTVTLGRA